MPAPVSAYAKNGQLVETFSSMSEALRYVTENRLGPDWASPALPESATDEDRLLLSVHLCHRALRPQWRRIQLNRLMSGEIRALPDRDWSGLETGSVLAIRNALEEAGETGWSAVSGKISGRRSIDAHIWLEHEDGRVLDPFPPFGHRDPVLYFEPDLAAECGYGRTGTPAMTSGDMVADEAIRQEMAGSVLSLKSVVDQIPVCEM